MSDSVVTFCRALWDGEEIGPRKVLLLWEEKLGIRSETR